MARPLDTLRGLAGIAREHLAAGLREAANLVAKRRAYQAASLSPRLSRWTPTGTSADAEISRTGDRLRHRSRDAERNSPHGRRIILEFAADLVGPGLRPQCETGVDRTNRQWQALWDEWASQCDPVSRGTIYGQQFAAAMALCRDGGVLWRRVFRRLGTMGHDGRPLAVPLEIFLLELDHLDTSADSLYRPPGGGYVVGGVEFDAEDRRVAYHLYPTHPGDSAHHGTLLRAGTSVRVPASEVLHLYGYTTGRPSQVQAVPWLHAVLTRLQDYDGYVDGTTLARRTSAAVAAFVHGGDPDAVEGETDGLAPAPVKDSRGYPVEHVEPGIIAHVPAGKDISFPDLPKATDYAEFARVTLHEIMAGAATPYEAGTGDLSEVSFISARMGRLSRRRLIDALREQVFVPLVLQPLARWFTEAAILGGRLPDRKGGYPVEWHDTGREDADEQARVKAIAMKIRLGLTSWARAVREEGLDPEALADEIKAGWDMLDALGIVLDCDPRRTTGAGVWQAGMTPPESSEALRLVSERSADIVSARR